jgi:hypothetical protein
MNNHLRLKMSVALYLLFIFIILFYKPQFIFTKEGNLKEFGTGEDKTIMPLWIMFGLISIISYYLTLVLII